MGRLIAAALCAGMLLQPSLSAALSDYVELQIYNSAPAECPSSLPDMIFLSGGACESAQSIRCINGSAAERLQWPYLDCSGVPTVIDATTFPPPCYFSKGFSGPLETDICVTAPVQLTFPVRRAGFVNFYQRDYKGGDVCDFPPDLAVSTNILIPLDKCVHDGLLSGIAKTYSCSAAGLTVTTFSDELCSRSTPPIAVVYPTDECLVNAPSLPGAWLISCPEPEPPVPPVPPPQAAASNAGLIGGLVVGGLIIAAAGGFFLWTRRASLFAGANVMNGASQKAPMGSVYAALDSRASEM
jgi:hypothetical protein